MKSVRQTYGTLTPQNKFYGAPGFFYRTCRSESDFAYSEPVLGFSLSGRMQRVIRKLT